MKLGVDLSKDALLEKATHLRCLTKGECDVSNRGGGGMEHCLGGSVRSLTRHALPGEISVLLSQIIIKGLGLGLIISPCSILLSHSYKREALSFDSHVSGFSKVKLLDYRFCTYCYLKA